MENSIILLTKIMRKISFSLNYTKNFLYITTSSLFSLKRSCPPSRDHFITTTTRVTVTTPR